MVDPDSNSPKPIIEMAMTPPADPWDTPMETTSDPVSDAVAHSSSISMTEPETSPPVNDPWKPGTDDPETTEAPKMFTSGAEPEATEEPMVGEEAPGTAPITPQESIDESPNPVPEMIAEPPKPIKATVPPPLVDKPPDTVVQVASLLARQVADLQQQKQTLMAEIEELQKTKASIHQEQMAITQAIGRLTQEALSQFEQRKQTLQVELEKLERRRDRIRKEMQTTFAGVSQDLAIRVQGFKDYLVGSLQDLAGAAEQLELTPSLEEMEIRPAIGPEPRSSAKDTSVPSFAEQGFAEQSQQIRRILEQYRNLPDYYGPPWQLRRTFEPIHAQRVSNWFFTQGGRGALRSMGSRLQNILLASAIISVLRSLYPSRLRTLVLANSPERLGEWRRGLQDCLGISRADFGPESGVTLFEEPELLAQKADRLVKDGKLPLIIVDDTEDKISLSMLQYPLWLAFAPDPQTQVLMDKF